MSPRDTFSEASALEVFHASAQSEQNPVQQSSQHAPILLLHGAFTGAWCWLDTFLPAFAAAGREVSALSFRGHGGSAGAEDLDRWGIDDYVSDVATVAADFDRPPILVGHSMGGFVAMRYAERFDTAGLVLLASVPPMGLYGPSISLALWNPLLINDIGMVQNGHKEVLSVDSVKRTLFSPAMPNEKVAQYAARIGKESATAILDMQGRIVPDTTAIRAKCPSLVLGGRKDALIAPAFVRATARSLDTSATIYPDKGHALMLEPGWDRIHADIRRWIAENAL